MSFYYINILSAVPLAVAYVVMALLFAGIGWLSRNAPRRLLIRAVAAVILLLLPVSEELWIAWNFARACEQAEVAINKKVQADGFYSDTGASLDLVQSGGYRFVEGPRRGGGVDRVTRGDAEMLKEALRRFAESNPRKDPMKEDMVRVRLDGAAEGLVFPKSGSSWRIERLDKPSARFHYLHPHDHTRVAHKIDKNERQIVDSTTNEILAREINFGRDAPWFYIGLDRPLKMCYGRRDADSREMLYTQVVIPTK